MNFFLFSFIAYIAGILTFLAPCTLPIIPIYLSIALQQKFRSLTKHTLLLGSGMALVFIILGVFAGSIGSFVTLHKEIFTFIAGLLFIILGVLMLFGITFDAVLPKQKSFTPLATILYGALMGLAWTGCVGPVLGGILVLAASTGTIVIGGFLLFIYAVGLFTPLLILSIISDYTGKVPRVWKWLHGRIIKLRFGSHYFEMHTTNMVGGLILLVLGVLFLLNGEFSFATFLGSSPQWALNFEDYLRTLVLH